MTSGNLWNYYRDEAIENEDEINKAGNYGISNSKKATIKSLEVKAEMYYYNYIIILRRRIVVPLKYLSNFWRFLDLSLINSEIELDLSWLEVCVVFEISRTPKVSANSAPNPSTDLFPPIQTTTAIFQIYSAKLYVPVSKLSVNDNNKFLENIKQGFKRTVSWKKYESEITTQTKKQQPRLYE